MTKAEQAPVFALIDDIDTAARVMEELQQIGVPDDKVEIMTGLPVDHAVLGRPKIPERMTIITPIGAIIGFITALLFVFGTIALYPIRVGGHAYFALPPKLVIMYELTMLGIILSTFFAGVYWQTGMLPFRKKIYHPDVSDGRVAFVISVTEDLRQRVLEVLQHWGAEIKEPEWRTL